ncbi:MAG: DUF2264 domain-containing protein [Planctomycetota bacterium]
MTVRNPSLEVPVKTDASTDAPAPSTQASEAPRAAEAYAWFRRRAEVLLKPIVESMTPGRSAFALEGRESSHGVIADRLEAFARPMLLAALWIQADRSDSPDGESIDRAVLSAWVRDAIRLGTDPESPEYWGNLTNYHQHAVEMAIIAMALEEAREELWEPLAPEVRERFAAWIGQIRGHAGHTNNHWFFDVLVLEFLSARGMGEPGDEAIIASLMDELETMYRRDGWFIDGCNETYDHYNAFSFHTYGLHWARRYGHRDPERRDRWLSMSDEFIASYASLFAATGEHVPLGRSLTYRFNAASVFPLAALMGVGGLPAGELRRLTRLSLEFFGDFDGGDTPQPIGWTDRFESIAEPYSCEASPYWSSKVFFCLTLPRDHEFFTEPESSIASERSESARVVRAPAWIVRHIGGEAEIIASGARCSPSSADRFGPWKWGRLSTRTGSGWLVPAEGEGYPADASLTARPVNTQRWFGRQTSVPVEITDRSTTCVYGLGDARSGFHVNVRTSMWWNAGWVFALHRVRCWQPSVLRHGGFAIPVRGDALKLDQRPGFARTSCDTLHASIQVITGFDGDISIDPCSTESGAKRRHLTSNDHALAIAHLGSDQRPIRGEHECAVIFGCTKDPREAQPWSVERTGRGWALSHDALGEWRIDI